MPSTAFDPTQPFSVEGEEKQEFDPNQTFEVDPFGGETHPAAIIKRIKEKNFDGASPEQAQAATEQFESRTLPVLRNYLQDNESSDEALRKKLYQGAGPVEWGQEFSQALGRESLNIPLSTAQGALQFVQLGDSQKTVRDDVRDAIRISQQGQSPKLAGLIPVPIPGLTEEPVRDWKSVPELAQVDPDKMTSEQLDAVATKIAASNPDDLPPQLAYVAKGINQIAAEKGAIKDIQSFRDALQAGNPDDPRLGKYTTSFLSGAAQMPANLLTAASTPINVASNFAQMFNEDLGNNLQSLKEARAQAAGAKDADAWFKGLTPGQQDDLEKEASYKSLISAVPNTVLESVADKLLLKGIPLPKFLKGPLAKIAKTSPKMAFVADVASRTAAKVGLEGATETGQQLVSNLVSSTLAESKQPLTQGLKESFVGGLGGGFAAGPLSVREAIHERQETLAPQDRIIVEQAASQAENLEAAGAPQTAQAVQDIAINNVVENKFASADDQEKALEELQRMGEYFDEIAARENVFAPEGEQFAPPNESPAEIQEQPSPEVQPESLPEGNVVPEEQATGTVAESPVSEVVPHNFQVTDAQDAEAVIEGKKPIAMLSKDLSQNRKVIKEAKKQGLEVVQDGASIIIFPAENRPVFDRLQELRDWASRNIARATPEQIYQYHKEVGTIFGYPEVEVEAFAKQQSSKVENRARSSEVESFPEAIPNEQGMLVAADGQEYANTPRMQNLVRRGNSIRQSLPPVEDGFVRLWRANRPGETGSNPSYTSSLEGIALPFHESYQGELSYVDVPTDVAKSSLQKTGTAEGVEFSLPKEYASKAKPIPIQQPSAPVTLSQQEGAQIPQEAVSNEPQNKGTIPPSTQGPQIPAQGDITRGQGTSVASGESNIPAHRVQLKGTPQSFTIVQELPQSEAEKANNERYYEVKNERTGETQTIESRDIAREIKPKSERVKKAIAKLPKNQQAKAEQATELDTSPDPYQGAPLTDGPPTEPEDNLPFLQELSNLGVFDEDATGLTVLQNLAKGTYPDWQKRLAKRILELKKDFGVQAVNRPESTWIGLKSGDQVLFNLARTGIDPAHILLHEGAHILTLDLLRNPDSLTGEQAKAYDELQGIYSELQALPQFQGEYGLTNVQEMVAEAFGNAGFRAKLQDLSPENKPSSIWRRFIRAVARLLFNKNVQSTSTLEKVIEAAFTLANAPVIESQSNGTAAIAEPGSWRSVLPNPNASQEAEAKALVEASQELDAEVKPKAPKKPLTEAQNKLIEDLGKDEQDKLLKYWANRIRNIPGMDFEDRLQEGWIGLTNAVRTYDSNGGSSFKTWASQGIRQHLLQKLREANQTSNPERKTISGNVPIYEDTSEGIVDVAPAPEDLTVEQNELSELRSKAGDAILGAMGRMSERDRNILKDYASGMSLREVGQRNGVSAEGANKIIKASRNLMRRALKEQGIESLQDILIEPQSRYEQAQPTQPISPEDEQSFNESTVGTLERESTPPEETFDRTLSEGEPIDEGVFAAEGGNPEAQVATDAIRAMSGWVRSDTEGISPQGREDIRLFHENARTPTLGEADARAAIPVRVDSVEFSKFQDELEKVFGKRIIFLEGLPENGPSGVYLKNNPGAIYLNVNGNYPLMFLTGHEFGHDLKNTKRDLYNELQQFVLQNASDWSKYRDYLIREKGYTEAAAADEFVDDFIGANFNDGKFWRKLWQKDKPLFERIVQAAMDFLNQLTGKVSAMTRDVRPYFQNWEEMQDRMVSLVEQVQQARGNESVAPMAERAQPNPEFREQFNEAMPSLNPVSDVIERVTDIPLSHLVDAALSKPASNMEEVYRRIGEQLRYTFGLNDRLTETALDRIKAVVDKTAKPLSMGPGAASSEENLTGYEERSFGQRFVDDRAISKDIRQQTGNRYYEPIPNKVTAEEARQIINERGVDPIISQIKDESNGLPFHTRSTMGQIVIKRLNEGYNALKEKNPGVAEEFLRKATDLAEWQMDFGTRLGQGVQSFAMWSRLTPEGKLLTYQKAVRKARERFKQTHGEKVRQIIESLNSSEDKELTAKELAKNNSVARRLSDQLKKLIQASKDGELDENTFYQLVSEKLGLPGSDPEVAKKVLDLAKKVDQASTGIPKDRAALELSKYIASQKGFAPSDIPMGIYYGNILSGYNTHLVNAIDTFLNVFSETSGLAMTNPKAAVQIYKGLFRGLGEGKADALMALSEGRMATDEKWMDVPKLMEIAKFGVKGGVPVSTLRRSGKILKNVAEHPLAYPLNAYKYVGRALSAMDALNFRGAKEANAALLAYRLAESEGLKGDELVERMNDILALNKMPDLLKYAQNEGFKGNEATARAIELREQLRDSGISDASSEFAGEATYNHEPHGALGQISNSIANLSNKLPALKLFVPFTRIVANVTNRGLNYTPLGYKRGYLGYTGEGPLSGDARKQMFARANLGTAGLVALGLLHAAGIIAINGAGPSDREKKKQLQAAGWKPYSIKIGDKYYNYTYTPIGLGLSILGNMFDSYKYGELSRQDAGTRAAYAAMRVGSTVFSQSFLSGLSNLFDLLSQEPGKTISAGKGVISSTASAFTTPTLFRDISRLFDNKLYQSNSISQDFIRNTPFAGLALKPTLNALGEPVTVPRQRFFTSESDDPAWKLIVEKNLRIPVPSKTTPLKPGGVEPISPEQYYNYLQQSGQMLKKFITEYQQQLSSMNTEDAQEVIEKRSEQIHKAILPKIRRQK